MRAIHSVRVCAALLACAFAHAASAQSYINFEGKQTSPVRLSPSGNRLFTVNTPDNRLSVFDVSNPQNPILMAEIPVGIEPVSVNAISDDEAWVVNEVSDSVSIVSVSRHIVTATLYVKDEPADVAFANGRAFVTCARNNQIAVFDAATHAVITNISLFGENPRSICVNSNGTRVYAAFALSGNRTTLIPFNLAPLPPPPTNPNLPPPTPVSLIVDAADPAWTNGANAPIKFTMPDNDVVEIDTATLGITRYFSRVGAVNFAVAVRPNSGDLYVANTDARNLTRFEPVLRGAFITNQISRINITSGVVTRYDLNPGFNYTNFPSLPNKTNALAQPTAIAFGPSGGNYFITAFGSDRVAIVDANSGAVTARIELNPNSVGSIADPKSKRGPRGLALKPGTALYVANRISNTLTVIDPVSRTVIREIPIGSYDPTPTVIRQGRGFLYDAKLSGNGTVSCASCHIDAEMDLLAWDLGNPGGNLETNRMKVAGSQTVVPGGIFSNVVFHPMKGPMTTQTLRGLNGLDPLHWRGERTNFSHFNGAFDALLGGTTLSDADMNLYRSYINTIVYQPNPNQNLDRTLPATFAGGDPNAGRMAYLNTNYSTLAGIIPLRCNTCHALPNGTDRGFTPAAALEEPQDFKVPQLRATYQKMRFTNAPGVPSINGFGLVHDGSDPSLFAFLSRSVFGTFANDAVVKRNLSAFVQCLDTGMAPAVGHARTVASNTVNTAAVSNNWSLLEAQAIAGTNIDLVVKGRINGALAGLLYQPASNNYFCDKTGVGPFTRAQLAAFAQSGDTFTLTGVPVGSGRRVGIERRLNGVLDRDASAPQLRIVASGAKAIVAWSTNGGFVLEAASALPTTDWAPETSLRGIWGSEYNMTNSPATNRFFRLKQL